MPRRDIQATTETAPCQATKSVLQQSNDNNRRWRGGRLAKRWCKKDENSGNRTKKQLLRAEQIRIFRKFILQSPKENPRKLHQSLSLHYVDTRIYASIYAVQAQLGCYVRIIWSYTESVYGYREVQREHWSCSCKTQFIISHGLERTEACRAVKWLSKAKLLPLQGLLAVPQRAM